MPPRTTDAIVYGSGTSAAGYGGGDCGEPPVRPEGPGATGGRGTDALLCAVYLLLYRVLHVILLVLSQSCINRTLCEFYQVNDDIRDVFFILVPLSFILDFLLFFPFFFALVGPFFIGNERDMNTKYSETTQNNPLIDSTSGL